MIISVFQGKTKEKNEYTFEGMILETVLLWLWFVANTYLWIISQSLWLNVT